MFVRNIVCKNDMLEMKNKMNNIEYIKPGERGFLEKGALISVVVPVYNMEKYLSRCIDSILDQTYQNLEIILVNDASTDDSLSIIEEYIKTDERIKVISHKTNMGLFQARITGSEIANGKYIAFVDSDDYISCDWFRKLVSKAEYTGSDVVVGEWCYDTNGEHKDYCNLDHFRNNDYYLIGPEIMDTFMKVQGRNFSFTVVWNKLYTKSLWDKCYPFYVEFSHNHGHMIMWEDIAFSSALWAFSEKVSNIHGGYYYYFKHAEASTASKKNNSRNRKYIKNASGAMNFFEHILKSTNLYEKYEYDFDCWKKHGMSIVYKDIVIDLKSVFLKNEILQAFNCNDDDYSEPPSFFYSITTPVQAADGWHDDIKKHITNLNTKYVSFDVFDTLIQRPFLIPSDLFMLLSERLNEEISSYVDFKAIREHAEATVRKQKELMSPSIEEITFDEIYQYIKDNYLFSEELVDEIKNYEIELELEFCKIRNSGKELFDLAIEANKQVIICSDMYLSREVVERILLNNGIKGYSKLYVSSEIKFTKHHKSLYKFVQNDLNCIEASTFVHIGDNYYSDIENASSCGWRTGHLAKASDVLQNFNPGVYGGEAFNKLYRGSFLKEDYNNSLNGFTSVRCILGMISNKVFDNPYISVNPWSDFNADAKMIGYATLGPHLVALCNWIYKISKREHIGTVHFVARDGFLVKEAFDSFAFPNVNSNYLRLSRKALILADVNCVEDIYSVYTKITPLCPPMKLAEYFAPIIPEEKKEKLESIFEKHGFKFERKLKSTVEWEYCINIFIKEVIDMEMLPVYKAKLKEYFSSIISPGDYIFDIGYSGRPESALSSILGFPVGSMYIHVNGEIASIRQEKFNCPTEVFYNYKPSITGVIREHLLMELGPSTVGYQEINGKFAPVFEKYKSEYCSEWITKVIQSNAIQFVRDFTETFGKYKILNCFQNEVVSAPLEYYLHYSKEVDRKIFSTLPFEDDLGEGKVLNALEFWNNEVYKRNYNSSLSGVSPTSVLPDLYVDGYFVKFYNKMNKMFPKGGKMRSIVKKLASIFLH